MQGSTGPHSRDLGYGLTIGALSGLHHLSGLPDRLPAGTGTNYRDHMQNPCHAVFAMTGALCDPRCTGEGEHNDTVPTELTIARRPPAVTEEKVKVRIALRNGHNPTEPAYTPSGANEYRTV